MEIGALQMYFIIIIIIIISLFNVCILQQYPITVSNICEIYNSI